MRAHFRRVVAILALALIQPLGGQDLCGQDSRQVPVGIEELRDDQFDRLVQVLAGEIRATLEQGQFAPDCTCRAPRVLFDWANEPAAEARFSGQLAAGLGPRLAGRMRFVERPESMPRLSCVVEFTTGDGARQARQLRFVLRDEWAGRAILTLDFDYTPRGPGPAPRAAERRPARLSEDEVSVEADSAARESHNGRERKSKREKRLKLDLSPRELADRVADGLSAYDDQTLVQAIGRIVFLDGDDARRFWITSVQAERRDDDRLRIQVAIRARGERRKAQMRMVYLDGAGRPLAVSHVHEYSCPQSQTVTAIFEATDPRVAGYVCLFEGD